MLLFRFKNKWGTVLGRARRRAWDGPGQAAQAHWQAWALRVESDIRVCLTQSARAGTQPE